MKSKKANSGSRLTGCVFLRKTLRRAAAGEAMDKFDVQSQGGLATVTLKIFELDSIGE